MADLAEVMSLYDEVLAVKDNIKFSNWKRGVYPTEEYAVEAIERGELYFFCEDGVKKGGVVLDSRQPDDYQKVAWQFPAPPDKVMVVHTLCIVPKYTGMGAAGRLLEEVEKFAKAKGYISIRFDTYCDNIPARRVYHRCGYTEVGMTGIFVYGEIRMLRCFEKKL